MEALETRAVEFALLQIEDGMVWERFSNQFLGALIGAEFIPIGEILDKGIDGLEHVFFRGGAETKIYQASIEKNPEYKIEKTLKVLKDNKVKHDYFHYVTNQNVSNEAELCERFYDKYKKPTKIFDVRWFSAHVNDKVSLQNIFRTFVDSYLHEFSTPGRSYKVKDLGADPRLFVYL